MAAAAGDADAVAAAAAAAAAAGAAGDANADAAARADKIGEPKRHYGRDWIRCDQTIWYPDLRASGDPLTTNFTLTDNMTRMGNGVTFMSKRPFNKGGMRYCYYLATSEGMFVAKYYSAEIKSLIKEGRKRSEVDEFKNDAAAYLVSQQFADKWNAVKGRNENWKISFVKPHICRFNGRPFFVERYVDGHLIKWNCNDGTIAKNQL